MKAELKKASVNQIIKGYDIFVKGEDALYVGLVLKGRIKVHAEGVNLEVGSGHFLGICDLPDASYRVTYTATTNSAIYIFEAKENLEDTLDSILSANKEYGALMVSAMNKYIRGLGEIYQSMEEQAENTFLRIGEICQSYHNMCKQHGTQQMTIDTDGKLLSDIHQHAVNTEQIMYYQACAVVKPEVQKAFYGSSETIIRYHLAEQIELVRMLREQCEEAAKYLQGLMQPLMLSPKNLYQASMNLTSSLQNMDVSTKESMKLFDGIIDQINGVEAVLYDKASIDMQIDHEAMEEQYFSLLSRGNNTSGPSVSMEEFALVEDNFVAIEELDGAMDQILAEAELDADKEQEFRDLISRFENMPDKSSTSDEDRSLRRGIMKVYYDIYEKVFLHDYEREGETPLVIDMFLRYGYLSETLLSEELREELLSFERGVPNQGECQVYDMKEWLTAIIRGDKEPSKNDFDQDYQEYLREQKKVGAISADEMKKLEQDLKAKMHYEIQNMFRSNQRLLSGQTAIFVPFLYTEGCLASLSRSYLSKDKVTACIRKLCQIDYSVFYREILYTEGEWSEKKEHIMEEVFPDVIVMPGCGSKGLMWQELSGRKRNSKGRFLMPLFFEGELDAVMIALFGRFRWELCRTMQGGAWNNVQIKSLTSEYSDFIQFYKKNRELSDTRKEKLKLQIQKSRNNTREVFVLDYLNWIRHESKGGMLLSKPVREIMATYCPFSKEIRESIADQPLFKEAMARYQRENGKKQKEYDLKFRVWDKDGIEVPEAIKETQRFYKDM
ncbi:MAG: hypothetical protein K2K70_12565 [Lachnospiraceae bacterium]|nr:hypothetical protein [Lachnospiraceae bacterium]